MKWKVIGNFFHDGIFHAIGEEIDFVERSFLQCVQEIPEVKNEIEEPAQPRGRKKESDKE